MIGGATAIGGAAMSARGAQKGQQAAAASDKETALMQANEGRKTSAFEADLADYYGQLSKQRRRDARAANFASYSKKAQPADYVRKPLVGDKPLPPVSALPVEEKKKKKSGGFLKRMLSPDPTKHLDPGGLFS